MPPRIDHGAAWAVVAASLAGLLLLQALHHDAQLDSLVPAAAPPACAEPGDRLDRYEFEEQPPANESPTDQSCEAHFAATGKTS